MCACFECAGASLPSIRVAPRTQIAARVPIFSGASGFAVFGTDLEATGLR